MSPAEPPLTIFSCFRLSAFCRRLFFSIFAAAGEGRYSRRPPPPSLQSFFHEQNFPYTMLSSFHRAFRFSCLFDDAAFFRRSIAGFIDIRLSRGH